MSELSTTTRTVYRNRELAVVATVIRPSAFAGEIQSKWILAAAAFSRGQYATAIHLGASSRLRHKCTPNGIRCFRSRASVRQFAH